MLRSISIGGLEATLRAEIRPTIVVSIPIAGIVSMRGRMSVLNGTSKMK